jgi:hypothetical protein
MPSLSRSDAWIDSSRNLPVTAGRSGEPTPRLNRGSPRPPPLDVEHYLSGLFPDSGPPRAQPALATVKLRVIPLDMPLPSEPYPLLRPYTSADFRRTRRRVAALRRSSANRHWSCASMRHRAPASSVLLAVRAPAERSSARVIVPWILAVRRSGRSRTVRGHRAWRRGPQAHVSLPGPGQFSYSLSSPTHTRPIRYHRQPKGGCMPENGEFSLTNQP